MFFKNTNGIKLYLYLILPIDYLSSLSPKFMSEPNLQCAGILVWGLWEVIQSYGQSPHKQDECPHRRNPRDPGSLRHVRTQGKTVVYEPGSRLSPAVLTLDFPTSRTRKNKFLWFVSYPEYGNLNGLGQHYTIFTSFSHPTVCLICTDTTRTTFFSFFLCGLREGGERERDREREYV